MTATLASGAAAAPSARPAGADTGFFAYHGIWAPGVRLFRALRFSAKAVIISLAFVVPLLGLIGWQLMHQADLSLQARQDSTRQHVEIAHGILEAARGIEWSAAPDRAFDPGRAP